MALGLAALLFAKPPIGARAQASVPEVRAMWVLRSSVTSPGSIATLVRSAREHGFNTLLVQVRGRGDAYYEAGIEPRATELGRQPKAFDPLANLLAAAHAADIRVHAWINVSLVSSATYLPQSTEHIVRRHPEWLMVPRELARELSGLSPAHPTYLNRLARWTRERSADVEGLYASPTAPAAVDHVRRVVREIVRRYAVDGVHFDYVRYPNDRFDYSRAAVGEFRRSVESRLPAASRQLLARSHRDPFALADALADEWREFRMSRMTSLVGTLAAAVRAERPGTPVSAAVAADMQEARAHRLQDWPRWLREGIVDAVCPMAYTTDPAKFADQIAAAREAAGDRAVWAGIGAYRLTPQQTVANIQTARRLGTGGVVLFSYDSLIDARQAPADYLSRVARGAFAAAPAAHGSR